MRRRYLAISPNEQWVAVGTMQGTVVLDRSSGEQITRLVHSDGECEQYCAVSFSADAPGILAMANAAGTLHLVDVNRSRWLRSFQVTSGEVCDLVFTPDGRSLAVLASDAIAVWELETGVKRFDLIVGDPGRWTSIAISNDGRTVAASSLDGVVRPWSLANGRKLCDLSPPGDGFELHDVAFASDDGDLPACGSSEWTLDRFFVWSARAVDNPVNGSQRE